MMRAFSAAAVYVCLVLSACQRVSPAERKLVGAWSWTSTDIGGRTIFSADYTVKEALPTDGKDGRIISDDEFEIVSSGTWRLEGDVLITKVDNKPLIAMLQRLASNKVPPFEETTKRQRIVRIDEKKMVFENGSSLDRVHR